MVELARQLDRILELGAVGPVTWGDLSVVGAILGRFRVNVDELHSRTSDFIHKVVVCRESAAVTSWRRWILEDPLIHPHQWLRADMVPPAPFCFVAMSLLR